MSLEIKEGHDLLDNIVSRIKEGDFNFATVGVHSSEDGDLINYAIKNEFGTNKIPSRPFIRQTFDKHKEAILEQGNKLFAAIRDGKIKAKEALFFWGEFYQNLIQKEINEGSNFTPNAASTLRAKGGNKNPLQDSGRLQQSIKTVVS